MKCETCDVLIDATRRDVFIEQNIDNYKKLGKPLVIATTGFNKDDEEKIKDLSTEIPVCKSANFSEELLYFIESLKTYSKFTNTKNVVIVEYHHINKKDIPSGTSLLIRDEIIAAKNNYINYINENQNKKKETETLSHSEFMEIVSEAKRKGSMKDAFLEHNITEIPYLAHSITNVGNLFPESKAVSRVPEIVDRDQTWVGNVMASVKHTPFSRVKSFYANITADEARAKGYVKGAKKVEEVITALKRTTDPQTVYKLQKMDRDDIIDITDFDVVAWLKGEMRGKLDEEIARAILIGDGRSSSSADKVDPLKIRPVYQDDTTYTIKRILTRAAKDDDSAFAKAFIKDVVKSRKEYKGSGNPTLYTTEDMLTSMLLIEDTTGRVIYDTIEKLKTALRVRDIVTVPVMENVGREDTGAKKKWNLLGVLVNLSDYNVGADKGGSVNMFDDFDINYNKYEYLIETRCSGALVKPYSAITFEEEISTEGK